ncbi:MAG: hypothetical protein EZS28_044762 [Streblomastix strix]|uniref:Uncharacterized protein n=1 Tax=Streblomastix strix TaxID=222440 RepID=A0A5J4TQK7_9EUKA|nr:MAG: hypothetical protein EZS28_044762 [Streblomastix strix]
MIPVKRKHNETQLADGQSSTSLQAQFLQQRQKYSKFNSLADQKITQDLVRTFEGVLKKPVSKFDNLNHTLEPIAKQKHNEDISWNSANVIIPMPEVGPILKEEGPGQARRSLESSAAVTIEMTVLINDAVRNETDNLVQTPGSKQNSRLDGVYQKPETEDVLSQHTQQRFKRKSGKQISIERRKSFDSDKFGEGEVLRQDCNSLDLTMQYAITTVRWGDSPLDLVKQLNGQDEVEQQQCSESPKEQMQIKVIHS